MLQVYIGKNPITPTPAAIMVVNIGVAGKPQEEYGSKLSKFLGELKSNAFDYTRDYS